MKSRTNPFRLLSTAAAALALVTTAHADSLTWDGATNNNWNTTDDNWSPSLWSNSNPDNAIFNNVSGTITLTEAITAGSLSFQWNGYGATREPILTGSSLSVGSISVNGVALGGGVNSIGEAYTVRARVSDMTLNVSGNVSVQRGMLYVFGGSTNLNVSGGINNVDAWNIFRVDSGSVTATGGIDFSSIASTVDLKGGTVTTPFIKVGNANWDGGTGLFLSGGVNVVATQDNSDFLQVYVNGNTGNRTAASLGSGGMTLNTSTYEVTVATQLNGSGSLTKTGSGTLTLTQSNNYTGGTNVSDGMLELKSGAWALNNVGGGGVTVGSGATLRADNCVANQLNGLTLNSGTVDAINSSGNGDWGDYFLTGNVSASGTSNLNADVALRSSNVDFSVASGGTLNVGGTLHNGAYYGIYSGSPATVSKSGDGTMVFAGAHTYTGATNVNGGKLVIDGDNSAATGAVSVASGATLGGSGIVGGATTISGTHAPGNSPDVQSFSSNLNYASTAIFEWDLASSATGTRGTQYDGVNVGGTLSGTTGAAFKVVLGTGAFTDTFWDTNQSWIDIFKAGVDGSGSALDIAGVFSVIQWYEGTTNMTSLTGTQGYFTLNGSDLSWTAVPEPTSALAGLLLTAGLLRRRRVV